MAKRADNVFRPRNTSGWEGEHWVFIIRIDGKRKVFKGYTDKALTIRLKHQLEAAIERHDAGLPTQTANLSPLLRKHLERIGLIRAQATTDIKALLTQYHAASLGKNNGDDYVDAQKLRLLKLFAGCKMETLRDLDHRIITKWLTTLGYKLGKQEHTASVRTRNHYAGALRTFGEWLFEQDILEYNPFRRVLNVPAKGQEVIQRRAIAVEEQETLLTTVIAEDHCFGGLPAVSRAVLYFAAIATGLRARELASLVPGSFDWTAGTVTVQAKNTKNKKIAVLFLHPDLLPRIKTFAEGRKGKLWPGRWYRKAATMLRKDLKAAGIEFLVNDQRLDFHALRHTFNTGLGLAEVDPRVNQSLSRHSSLELTMSYTHLPDSRHKEGLAKLKLPKFPELPELPDAA